MCGIAGIVRIHPPGACLPPHDAAIPEHWLDLLDDAIRRRGPDGHGRFRDRAAGPDGSTVDVALIHRRLTILDPAGGHQPMGFLVTPGLSPPDGDAYARTRAASLPPCPRCVALGAARLAIVFNGCIYNHRALRDSLSDAGHTFSTDHSDTEALVHGWTEHGPDVFARLDAMHAVAVWDSARASLTLARDLAGEKPLYHAQGPGGLFVFASSVPAVLAVLRAAAPDDPHAADPDALEYWIRHGSAPSPPLRAVRALAPAEILTWPAPDARPPAPRRQARADAPPAGPLTSEVAHRLLMESVAARVESDVPLGCFLSGGIDSGLVAAFAHAALSPTGRRLRTLTLRVPGARFDESPAAELTAAHLGTDHLTLDCAPTAADDLVDLVETLGLPLGDSSILPTYWLCRAARAHVTVALAGDGGDEVFAGYDRHRAWRLARWQLALASPLSWLPPTRGGHRDRLDRLHRLAVAARSRSYRELTSIFQTPDLARLLGSAAPPGECPPGDDPRRDDLGHYLPCDLLTKTDAASMHVALEVRLPMLDARLIAAADRTPIETLLGDPGPKGLLRAVARRYLPAAVVDRPKQGFAIPIGDWFRTDFGGLRTLLHEHLGREDAFGPTGLGVGPMIRAAHVRRLLREHDAAGPRSLWPWKGRDHGQRLFGLLSLSIWCRWLARGERSKSGIPTPSGAPPGSTPNVKAAHVPGR